VSLPAGLQPLERDLVATFEVTRGSFIVPADLLGDEEREHELAILIARNLPERDPRGTLTTRWTRQRGGGAVVSWMLVYTRIRPA
jgi:hypothetical protein